MRVNGILSLDTEAACTLFRSRIDMDSSARSNCSFFK